MPLTVLSISQETELDVEQILGTLSIRADARRLSRKPDAVGSAVEAYEVSTEVVGET